MIQAILYTVGAWLGTSALFIGVPLTIAIRADRRKAAEAGARDPGALGGRRFALQLPRRGALAADLVGRTVWLERWSSRRLREKSLLRIEAIDPNDRVLLIRDETGELLRFRPLRESARFAAGKGIASGTIDDARAVAILV